jgi:flagellin
MRRRVPDKERVSFVASIMTNASALTALQSLSSTNRSLEVTQARISTGYRVAEAADNAAYWSIATTMRSDFQSLSTVQDSLGLGASKVDTAYTAMNKALETVDKIKVKLVAAVGSTPADKDKIQTEIASLQKQLKSFADSATFSGANWLSVNATVASGNPSAGVHADAQIVSSFTRDAAGNVTLGKINIVVQSVKLYDAAATTAETRGILEGLRLGTTGLREDTATAAVAGTVAALDGYAISTLTVVNFTDAQITQMIGVADRALAEMADAATNLGAAKKQIDLQKQFTTSLMDSIERGVGQLVDADMNKESTRLQALQVQQQLGIQALSIANSNAQRVLSLFQQ